MIVLGVNTRPSLLMVFQIPRRLDLNQEGKRKAERLLPIAREVIEALVHDGASLEDIKAYFMAIMGNELLAVQEAKRIRERTYGEKSDAVVSPERASILAEPSPNARHVSG